MSDDSKALAEAYAAIREARMSKAAAAEMVAIIEAVEGKSLSALATEKPEVVLALAEEVSTIGPDEF